MMRQLVLDISADRAQRLSTFIAGQNQELLALLQRCTATGEHPLSERFVFVWGSPGSGKTHLLRAMKAARNDACFLNPACAESDFTYSPDCGLYLIDDCEQLAPPQQIAAFALFNQAREHGAGLIATGAAAPAQLAVREDLRTRFGWGLIYQLHGLSDEDKIAALERAAQERGFPLAPGVLPYLITHHQRDMQSLSAMLDALDRYSLETKRPITLPLLLDLLQRDENGARKENG